MGDPVEVGTGLDRAYRPRPAWELLALTALLALLGAYLRSSGNGGQSPAQIIPGVAASLILGLGCMVGAYFLDFTLIGKKPLLIFFGTVAAAALPRLLSGPGAGIRSPAYYAQYVLLLFPLAYAALLYSLRGKGFLGLGLALAGAVVLGGCCLFTARTVEFTVMALPAPVLLFIASAGDWFAVGRRRSLVLSGAGALVWAAVFLWAMGRFAFFGGRLAVLIDPRSDPQGMGWQILHIREVIAGARLIGPGSAELHGERFLGSAELLLTRLIHYVGWIALIVILAVFGAFLFFGFRRCFKQQSMMGRLVSAAVLTTLALQVVGYVATNLGFGLFYCLSLPLLSYGNTAIVVNLALVGVMLSVFRTGALARDKPLAAAAV